MAGRGFYTPNQGSSLAGIASQFTAGIQGAADSRSRKSTADEESLRRDQQLSMQQRTSDARYIANQRQEQVLQQAAGIAIRKVQSGASRFADFTSEGSVSPFSGWLDARRTIGELSGAQVKGDTMQEYENAFMRQEVYNKSPELLKAFDSYKSMLGTYKVPFGAPTRSDAEKGNPNSLITMNSAIKQAKLGDDEMIKKIMSQTHGNDKTEMAQLLGVEISQSGELYSHDRSKLVRQFKADAKARRMDEGVYVDTQLQRVDGISEIAQKNNISTREAEVIYDSKNKERVAQLERKAIYKEAYGSTDAEAQAFVASEQGVKELEQQRSYQRNLNEVENAPTQLAHDQAVNNVQNEAKRNEAMKMQIVGEKFSAKNQQIEDTLRGTVNPFPGVQDPAALFKDFGGLATGLNALNREPYWAKVTGKIEASIEAANTVLANKSVDPRSGKRLTVQEVRKLTAERDAMQVARVQLKHIARIKDPSILSDVVTGIPYAIGSAVRGAATLFGANSGYALKFDASDPETVSEAGRRFAILLADAFETGRDGDTTSALKRVNEVFKEIMNMNIRVIHLE